MSECLRIVRAEVVDELEEGLELNPRYIRKAEDYEDYLKRKEEQRKEANKETIAILKKGKKK